MNFSDEPNINRKGTLHGLVTKSMLANRVKLAAKEGDPAAAPQEATAKATATAVPATAVKPLQPMLLSAATKADDGTHVTPLDTTPIAAHLNVPGGGASRQATPQIPGLRSPGRSSISMDPEARREDEEAALLEKATKSMMAELSSEPLPLQYVIQNLDIRVQATGLYKDFLLFIPFIILFFIFYLNGRNIEANHMSAAAYRAPLLSTFFPSPERNVQTALAQPVNTISQFYGTFPALPQDRAFADVVRAADFQLWFTDVVVPLIWDCSNPDVRHNPLQRRGQHIALGAMRMRVQVMKNSSCSTTTDMFNNNLNLSQPCFGSFSSSTSMQTTTCNTPNPANDAETLWTYVDPGILNSARTTGLLGVYPGGGYTATIPFNATCNEAREFAAVLTPPSISEPIDGCGIVRDASTRFIMVEWFQYNPSTDTFVASKLFYEVTDGGKWLPSFQFRAFPVWSSSRLGETGFDIFFLIFVLYFWYQFAAQWLKHYQRTQKILDFLLDAWNIIELTNLTTFLAVCILRFIWWSQSKIKNVSLPFADGYPSGLDSIVLLYSYQIYANAVNAVITVLKTLKYVRLNNRMNILTRTIDATKESLAGVMILFIFVVLGYSICGAALYGGTMWSFRTIDQSFMTLLFMLFGQFDYEAMRAVEPTLTGVFFFTYIILSQFLLLNFIIAILSEGFSQVSTSSAIEPLDQVLLRQLSSLKYTLHPKNLKQWILLTLQGKSRNDLIFEMTKYLQEHMDLIELEQPELLDNDLPITKDDLKNWLPEHLDQDIGDFYMAVLWDDIAHDYHIDITSEDYQQQKEIEALIKKGVLGLVNRTVTKFDQTEDAMRQLETAVSHLEGYVR